MFIFLKNIIKSEIQKIGIIKPFTYFFIIATICYAMVFVLPNFYKSDTSNAVLEERFNKLESKIDDYYRQDNELAQSMEEKETKKKVIKDTRAKTLNEYKNSSEIKQTEEFNSLLERNRKKMHD